MARARWATAGGKAGISLETGPLGKRSRSAVRKKLALEAIAEGAVGE
ncbi:hypothetical protein [Geitlerinema sp. PCC 7407]|nr:hypothetical protein [Geitlerinema sp. PCC 7407]